jgi:hypothetical protein
MVRPASAEHCASPLQFVQKRTSFVERFANITFKEALRRTNPFQSAAFQRLNLKRFSFFRFYAENPRFACTYQLYFQLFVTIGLVRLLAMGKVTIEQLEGYLRSICETFPSVAEVYKVCRMEGWLELRKTCEWQEAPTLDSFMDLGPLPAVMRDQGRYVFNLLFSQTTLTSFSVANSFSALVVPVQVLFAFVTAPLAFKLWRISPTYYISQFIGEWFRSKFASVQKAAVPKVKTQVPVPRLKKFSAPASTGATDAAAAAAATAMLDGGPAPGSTAWLDDPLKAPKPAAPKPKPPPTRFSM